MKYCGVLCALLAAHAAAAVPHINPDGMPSNDKGDNWAVIVVGSDGWYNYRHQADAAHAYQLFLSTGFPEENIILMMADDVANNENNPSPGVLINRPGGKDMYKGIKVDYRGDDVTPEMFKKLLLGEATHTGSNKTLGSGPNDNVFVNFVDHGGVGLIAFPRGAIMTSTDLVDTLKAMHKKRVYKQLVFFVEACEGGSMFEGLLPRDLGIYAHTAAGPDQSSYATYWDPTLRTFLGDAYSVAWMEDADSHFAGDNLVPETLSDQFLAIYRRIQTQSQPHQYGDLSLGRHHTIDEFEAFQHRSVQVPTNGLLKGTAPSPLDELVSSRDAKLFTLLKRLQENGGSDDQTAQELELEYRLRQEARDRFLGTAVLVAGTHGKSYVDRPISAVSNHQCLSAALRAFHTQCHTLDEYHLPYTRTLAHLCDSDYTIMDLLWGLTRNPLCEWQA